MRNYHTLPTRTCVHAVCSSLDSSGGSRCGSCISGGISNGSSRYIINIRHSNHIIVDAEAEVASLVAIVILRYDT